MDHLDDLPPSYPRPDPERLKDMMSRLGENAEEIRASLLSIRGPAYFNSVNTVVSCQIVLETFIDFAAMAKMMIVSALDANSEEKRADMKERIQAYSVGTKATIETVNSNLVSIMGAMIENELALYQPFTDEQKRALIEAYKERRKDATGYYKAAFPDWGDIGQVFR